MSAIPPQDDGEGSQEALAIIAYSCRFPGDADTPAGFWKVLQEKTCVMTEWPKDRLRLDAFFHRESNDKQANFAPGAHLLKEDMGLFDAPFFGISATEASAMDPQNRILLETTYHALEDAGIPMEQVKGSRTGVYSGSMTDDYKHLITKDVDDIPKYAATGVAVNMVANRISWFYDFVGPSINMDSACSSSLMAFHAACQGLRDREADMAVVAGASMALAPEGVLSLTNMGFLSTHGKCYSFDHRANGYARGEGFSVVLVKRLSDAIRDGNTIRAVIRSTGSNQDGHTPGVAQPSGKSQAALIRETYARAGLSLDATRFFEAHGTGTAIGDPIEAEAIGRTFRTSRSPDDPLYIGACKSNIGHLEGGSGLAGIIKSIMVLEKGVIPPNANFEQINPSIDAEFLNIKFPTKSTPWPSKGLRRASIASFGFGGSNAHAILDDAYNYMRLRQIPGKHRTATRVPELGSSSLINGYSQDHAHHSIADSTLPLQPSWNQRLLVFSAADESGVQRLLDAYQKQFTDMDLSALNENTSLNQLTYTLAKGRSIHPWKSFAVINGISDLCKLSSLSSKPQRTDRPRGIALVFTGQGAQYRGMGSALLDHPVFRNTLERCDSSLSSLGCPFSVIQLLLEPPSSKTVNIDNPKYSQPMTTALQIALFELLRSGGVSPSAVVGHSSGEIAAAYASGALDLASACKVSYFRGKLASAVIDARARPGAMMSVNQSRKQMELRIHENPTFHGTLHVACVNSPLNVTVSGDESAIDALGSELEAKQIFARKLATGVAYHSPHMNVVADEYAHLLSHLTQADDDKDRPVMVSSVTGDFVYDLSELRTPGYWVSNMVSSVEFTAAMSTMLKTTSSPQTRKLGGIKTEPIQDIVEIGPHAALRRPVLDILESCGLRDAVNYSSALLRNLSAVDSLFDIAGQLFAGGHKLDIAAINNIPSAPNPDHAETLDLPPYPFNHAKSYWFESALSRHGRRRLYPKTELCGAPVPDWNPREARWRKFFDLNETPWVADHKVNGRIIYPATGMVVMALEAAKQIADPTQHIIGYHLRDATFSSPITIDTSTRTEAQLYMRHDEGKSDKRTTAYEFRIYTRAGDEWVPNSRGFLQVHFEYESHQQTPETIISEEHVRDEAYYRKTYAEALKSCRLQVPTEKMYDRFRNNGLQYGAAFQALDNLAWDGAETAVGHLRCFEWTPEQSNNPRQSHVAHPVTLDAAGQLMWVTLTKGAQETIVSGAAVTRIQSAWMSNKGLSAPSTPYLRACCTGGLKGLRGTDSSMFALDAEGNPVLIIDHMETTAVGSSNDATVDGQSARQICFDMRWKPDPAFLTTPDLVALAAREHASPPVAPTRFYQYLERIQIHFAAEALKSRDTWDMASMPPHLKKYLAWLEMQLKQRHGSQGLPNGHLPLSNGDHTADAEDLEIQDLIEMMKNTNAEGRLFVELGQQLPAIFTGAVDPLEVVFKNGLAEKHYLEVCEKMNCRPQLQIYLSALAHKQPGLKILEIGAGTGSVTNYILDAVMGDMASLTDAANDGLARYDYTDISKAFFEQAAEMFAQKPAAQARMHFLPLDIEKDPSDQGFEEASYDVVIAAWVLHATRDLAATLRNTRRLLKPGGKLVLVEITEPGILRNGFVFGTLPGWWLSEEGDQTRHWSPCVDEKEWHRLLSESGFAAGVDLLLPDYDDPVSHENSIIVATATSQDAKPSKEVLSPGTEVMILTDLASATQTEAGVSLTKALQDKWGVQCITASTEEIVQRDFKPSRIVISLFEIDHVWLKNLDTDTFTALQRLVAGARTIIWATSSSEKIPTSADTQMITGLARVLCTERTNLRFITLALEDRPRESQELMQKVLQVFGATVDAQEGSPTELEYVERGGLLHINRVFASPTLNKEVSRRTRTTLDEVAWQDAPPLNLAIPDPGLLDSLRFEEDKIVSTPLKPDEIEIQVHSVGINFRDLLVALGKLPAVSVGCECAGIVTRVGSTSASRFSPGQRVCAVIMGCMRTLARCKADVVALLPSDMSFEEAAAVPVTGATAYHALVTIADLQPGESILIHSAAGGTGQMAVQIAQAVNAEVFATVGSKAKKQFLMDTYGIPEDHIFGSRDTAFAREIMHATDGKGVDVVLNSLAGQALVASWEAIAPFGRFLEIGKADIEKNSTLPMMQFSKNVSFSAIALDHMTAHRPKLVGRALGAVMRFIAEGKVKPARPLERYPIAKLEEAFRVMQAGQNIGKIVLTMGAEDRVKTYLKHKSQYTLDSTATYLIAGGLGGLGRSAARWMASRGAKHLILLSRSGPKSPAAQNLVAELQASGVQIATPKCDVSDRASLARVLAQCSADGLPPIKGCLQGTMVLQDALFETMSWDQWAISIRSKVDSTWNLHTLLPSDLSFFIMLSSVAGVAGSMGQSNYAAANTYQDALAAHRLASGLPAVSIDLGWMGDVGIVAENAHIAKGKEDAADLAQIFEIEFLALLDYYLDPSSPPPPPQPILGLVTLAQFHATHLPPPEWLTAKPLFKPLTLLSSSSQSSPSSSSTNPSPSAIQDTDLTTQYRNLAASHPSASPEDLLALQSALVQTALVAKLGRALSMPTNELDPSRPLHVYGVDSLLAVELRNWFARVFQADVPVFDITGHGSLAELAKLAAGVSEVK